MNILYLADPSSIHDIKWISYFTRLGSYRAFILPRSQHVRARQNSEHLAQITVLDGIRDFSIVRFYQTILTAVRIRNIIRKHGIDLVHILYAEPNGLWAIFRGFLQVPIIISTRGTDILKTIPEHFMNRNLINAFVAPAYRKALLKADWITCTSNKQLESISKLSGRQSGMSIVRTGVDMEILMPEAELPAEVQSGLPYILFPRFIKPIYNHEFCLRAIQQLPAEYKRAYRMIFVGKDSGDMAYQQLLQTMMSAMKDINFIFLKKQSQRSLIRLYKEASLVVMTPTSDGSPVSAMEALLCGRNLILGPLDYDADIFSDAIQLDKWDESELADKMVKVISGNLSVQVSEKVRELMDREYCMKELDLIYKRFQR